MSEARSFINPKAQNYATLKRGTPMNANQQAKFDCAQCAYRQHGCLGR